jgi:transglutaminase-like putative cysteine protease
MFKDCSVLLRIQHVTSYSYDKAVYCEPLTIRLRPRTDGFQRLESFKLHVQPEPSGITHFQDLHGNNVSRCWFKGFTGQLTVSTACVIETLLQNPFNFLLATEAVNVPLRHCEKGNPLWNYYAIPTCNSDKLRCLASDMLLESGGETLTFLTQLTNRIHHECELVVRPEGAALDPETTWLERRGACRDQAVLFNEVCRLVGLPARFVSGYGYSDFQDERHLHAWSEVYLPGAGWRGFDPTIGLAVSDRHIAVATARDPLDAAPTSGTYRGTSIGSSLDAQVMLHRLEIPKQAPQTSEVALAESPEAYLPVIAE